MPVDERTERPIDWDLVPEDTSGPVAALVAIAAQAVEEVGPWPGWRDELWKVAEEIGRLREIEQAAREVLSGDVITRCNDRGTTRFHHIEKGALRRLRTALDADRGGQGE